MPAILTHHIFGLETYEAMSDVIGSSAQAKQAFLLGNIGPDPLFCLKVAPADNSLKNIGSMMHSQRTERLLSSFHEHFVATAPGAHREVLCAYALGMCCHYFLDSTVHPLVYAQQYAFCNAGVEGLDRKHGFGATHALIETELDEYVLYSKLGKTVSSFVPHRELLKCSALDLGIISGQFSHVIADTYGLDASPSLFAQSVLLYRAAQRALDSVRDGVRKRFDYARAIGKPYLHILALSHTDCTRTHTAFANDEHFIWPHPSIEGETVSASFDELYELSLAKAGAFLPRFAEHSFTETQCETMVDATNFSGNRL